MLMPLALALAMSGLGSQTHISHSGDPQPIVVVGNNDGVVSTNVQLPGTPGATSTSGSSTEPVKTTSCGWVADTVDNAALTGGRLGEIAGSFFVYRCAGGSSPVFLPGVFVPAGPAAAPARVSPATLAVQASNRLSLPEPLVGMSPAGQGLVGLPQWLWVGPGGWLPLSQRTSAGPVWAQVTARPVAARWDLGDGSPALLCAGPGAVYDRARPAAGQATSCSHTFLRSSAAEPAGTFMVTVTVSWSVSWVGSGGSAGSLPVLSRGSSVLLPVAERQAVVIGGGG